MPPPSKPGIAVPPIRWPGQASVLQQRPVPVGAALPPPLVRVLHKPPPLAPVAALGRMALQAKAAATAIGHPRPCHPVIQKASLDSLLVRADKPDRIDRHKPVVPGRQFSAHHKADVARIRQELKAAISGNDQRALSNMARAARLPGGVPVAVVSAANKGGVGLTLAEEAAVKTFSKQIQWMNWDIFFGPLSDERKDDPDKTKQRLDGHYTASGHTTPKSELARDLDIIGFSGFDPADLTARLNVIANLPSPYVATEWQHEGTTTTRTGNVIDQYSQVNDPYNWDAPHAEIVFPKNGQALTASQYTIRIHANRKTNNVEVKIEQVGTTGTWVQARQTADGAWWFDWTDIGPGSYEIMARAWSARGQEFVSRHVRVTR